MGQCGLVSSVEENVVVKVNEDDNLRNGSAKHLTNEWLDKYFIQNALRSKNPKITVLKCNLKGALSPGENFLSLISRASCLLSEENDEYKKSFIIKTLPSGDKVSKYVLSRNYFTNEIQMLGEVIIDMEDILAKVGMTVKFAPELNYSQMTPHPVIIMEDLSPSGFKVGDRRDGLSLNQCMVVLKTIADFHVASMVLLKRKPELKQTLIGSLWSRQNEDGNIVLLKDGLEKVIENVDSWSENKWSEKLWPLRNKIPDKVYELVDNISDEVPHVLNHGDLWTNNVMFRSTNPGQLEGRLIDFQMCSVRSPVFDLLYFIFSAPRNDIRLTQLEFMLKVYHERWCQDCFLLGEFNAYTFDALKKDFQKNLLFGMAIHFGPFSVFCGPKNTAPDLSEGINHLNQSLYENDHFKEALLQALPYFQAQKLF